MANKTTVLSIITFFLLFSFTCEAKTRKDIEEWHNFVSEMSMDIYFNTECNKELSQNAHGMLVMYINLSNVSKRDMKKAKSQVKANAALANAAINSGIKPVCDKLASALSDDVSRISKESQDPELMQNRPIRESDFNL
ncbi:MAG: hypothetical protein EOM50_17765 [Erysipelotrichia bacterium]|nr:hypothetical protein [Erysipelotrichia bacterium]